MAPRKSAASVPRGIRSPDLSNRGDVLKHQPIARQPPPRDRTPAKRRSTPRQAHPKTHPPMPKPSHGSSMIQDGPRPVAHRKAAPIRSFSLRKEKEPKRNDYLSTQFFASRLPRSHAITAANTAASKLHHGKSTAAFSAISRLLDSFFLRPTTHRPATAPAAVRPQLHPS